MGASAGVEGSGVALSLGAGISPSSGMLVTGGERRAGSTVADRPSIDDVGRSRMDEVCVDCDGKRLLPKVGLLRRDSRAGEFVTWPPDLNIFTVSRRK